MICNKMFSQSSHVKSHMQTHIGEKLFSCSLCNKLFASKNGFKKHVRKHTNAISYSLLPKEATEDESYSLLPKEATEDESYSESPEEQSYAPNCGDNVVQNNIMTSESESREKSEKKAEDINCNFETTKKP